jgi:hypothetical protein
MRHSRSASVSGTSSTPSHRRTPTSRWRQTPPPRGGGALEQGRAVPRVRVRAPAGLPLVRARRHHRRLPITR